MRNYTTFKQILDTTKYENKKQIKIIKSIKTKQLS